MIIIIVVYVVALYLIFFKFRWLPWNSWTQYSSLFIGIVVMTAFLVGLRNTAPSSSQAAITARVIEIAPQVSGLDRCWTQPSWSLWTKTCFSQNS